MLIDWSFRVHFINHIFPSVQVMASVSRSRSFGRTSDVIFYFLLNMSSSFCLAAAHNVLFFVLDMRTVVLHFLHYALAFCLLVLCYALGMKHALIRLPIAPFAKLTAPFAKPVLTQLLIVLFSSSVHSQQKSGSLYLLRLFDFVTMITIIRYSKPILRFVDQWPSYDILLPIAIGGSLSWLEFGIIEYDAIALILSPLLAAVQGIQILQLKKYSKMITANQIQLFSLYFTGLTAAALSIPALHSWINSHVSMDASWESIDYVLIGMSAVFMANFKYSELWLQLNLDGRDFFVFEQSKFWVASIGQWFLQNMAHSTIFSLAGKILMFGGVARYIGYIHSRTLYNHETKQCCSQAGHSTSKYSLIVHSSPPCERARPSERN
ncbi:hypothetical protein Tcan_04325 [Toxocara canis]|uniref:Uncharacterized protein n=1 Tax=Toxocara canis TaxID=6265 RepID=A0A0B2VNT2_TOXCA|nr:hypothetical protein Tcan_04325 [Toxocara canis]